MAKKIIKNTDPSGAAAETGHTPHPADPDQPAEVQPSLNAGASVPASKPKSSKSKRSATVSAGIVHESTSTAPALNPEPESGSPVVSKSRRGKKKHDSDQPELNVATKLDSGAESPLPSASSDQAETAAGAEAEAAAQAADTFEEGFEERIPAERRDAVTLEIDPTAPRALKQESSIETGQPLDPQFDPQAPGVSASLDVTAESRQDVPTAVHAEEGEAAEYTAGDDEAEEEDEEEFEEDEEEEEDLDEENDESEDDEEDEDAEEDDEEDEEDDNLEEDEEDEEASASPERPAPNLQRLQKILSQAGIASRRHAEELITQGRVQVNGKIVTELGSKADPARDHIRVDGKLLHGAERLRYFVLNKPRGYVTTVSDPEGRPTVMTFFAKQSERLYPVGRLDYLSEGLLLMTNDGDLANKLTRAATGVEKTYLVKVSGVPTEEELDRLRSGISIDKGKPGEGRVHTSPASVRQVRQGDNPWYEVILVEGRNRELRKMFEEIGHFVEKIRRVGYGPLVLDQEPGQMRELEPEEVELLRKAAEGKLRPKARPKPSPKETGHAEGSRRDTRPSRSPGRPPFRSNHRRTAGDRPAPNVRSFPNRPAGRAAEARSGEGRPANRPYPRREDTGDNRRSGPPARPFNRTAPDSRVEGRTDHPRPDRGERPGRFPSKPPSREFRPSREGDSASQRRTPGNFAAGTSRPPQGVRKDRPAFPKRERPGGQFPDRRTASGPRPSDRPAPNRPIHIEPMDEGRTQDRPSQTRSSFPSNRPAPSRSGADRGRGPASNRGFARPQGAEGRSGYRREGGPAGRDTGRSGDRDTGRSAGRAASNRSWTSKPSTGGRDNSAPARSRGSFGDRPRSGPARPSEAPARPPRSEGRSDFPARKPSTGRPYGATSDRSQRPPSGARSQSGSTGPSGRPAGNRGGGKPGGFRSGPGRNSSGGSGRPRGGPSKGPRGGRPSGKRP